MAQDLHDTIRVERDGFTVVFVIDHPPANAISSAVVAGCSRRSSMLRRTCPAAPVVITGAGSKFFSAGADITELGNGRRASPAPSTSP